MADKRKGRTTSESARSKRPAPTIDLTATEIPQSAEPSAPSATEAAPSTTDAPASGGAAESTSEAAPEAERAPSEPETAAGEPSPELSQPEPTPAEEPPAAEPPDRDRGRPGFAAPLAAGVIGAALVAAILAGLWSSGILSGQRGPDLSPRLSALEQQVVRLQNGTQALQGDMKTLQERIGALAQAPASAVDPKAIDALADRVARLEAALKNLPANGSPQAADRLAGAENAIKANTNAVAELGRQIAAVKSDVQAIAQQAQAAGQAIAQLRPRIDALAKQSPAGVTPAQLQSAQQKIAGLEQSAQTAQKGIAQNAAAVSQVRMMLAASALRNAVQSHTPYQTELAQAKALGADATALAPLQRFAASGVPSDAQLAADLRKLLPELTQASGVDNESTGSFLERLRANAGRLVHVTPVNAPAGDNPSDVLARLNIEAANADLDAALRDIAKLPQAAQAKAAEWVARVKAQQQALSATRTLASDAAKALGGR